MTDDASRHNALAQRLRSLADQHPSVAADMRKLEPRDVWRESADKMIHKAVELKRQAAAIEKGVR